MDISSDDNDDYDDMKETYIGSEEDTTIESSKITSDCQTLADVDLQDFDSILKIMDVSISNFKLMQMKFENSTNVRKVNIIPNQKRLISIKNILNWIENVKKPMLEFKKNVEKKKNDSHFYLSKSVDTFVDHYNKIFKPAPNLPNILTCYLKDEPEFRLLPPHPELPHIMHLKNSL